jgi:hypothetical protein
VAPIGGVAQLIAGIALVVPAASAEELERHEAMLDMIHKASGGKAVWRAVDERLS